MKKTILKLLLIPVLFLVMTLKVDAANSKLVSNVWSDGEEFEGAIYYTLLQDIDLTNGDSIEVVPAIYNYQTEEFTLRTIDENECQLNKIVDGIGQCVSNQKITKGTELAYLIFEKGSGENHVCYFATIITIKTKSGYGEKITLVANMEPDEENDEYLGLSIYNVEVIGEAKEETEDQTIEMASDNKISASSLADVKTSGKKLTVESKKDDKVLYSWTFDGAKMDTTDFNLDLTLNIGTSDNKEKIEKLVSNKNNSLVLNFGYHGNLPKGTSVRVYVGDKYKDGDKLTLYYYNEETGKLEETTKDIEVKDGYITFDLEHCSDYVLEKQIKNTNNTQTSSINTKLYCLLSIISLSVVTLLIKKYKKIKA